MLAMGLAAWCGCLSADRAWASEAQITIAWDAPTVDTAGDPLSVPLQYRVYVGTERGVYTSSVLIESGTTATIRDLDEGRTYYFACTAISGPGRESARSSELDHLLPDQTPPSILVEGEAVAHADSSGEADVPDLTVSAVVADNCTPPARVRLVQTPAPGARLPFGLARILLTAIDEAGNEARRWVDLRVKWNPAIEARRPALKWSAVEGATWHQLWIVRNGGRFHVQWLNQADAEWVADFNFPAGSYDWWVRGWGPEIGFAAWEGAFAFDVPAMIPEAIEVLGPGGMLEGDELVCQWTRDARAIWYQVYVGRNGQPYRTQWVQAADRYSTGPGLPYGVYQCWVRGWSPDGYGPWSASEVATFGVTRLIGPSGAVSDTRRPTFSWEAVPGAAGYEIYVDCGGRKLACLPVDGTEWTPPDDLPGGSYKWWVRMRGESGMGPWTLAGEFSIPLAPPAALDGLMAEAGAESGVARYIWNADPTATWYEIVLVCDGQKVFSQWMETGKQDGALVATIAGHQRGKTYRWWVRAWNPDGTGPWSGEGVLVY